MKLAKSAVGFEHPAKGPRHCGECRHFRRASDTCEIVAGTVTPPDWCKRFVLRAADRAAKRDRHLNQLARP